MTDDGITKAERRTPNAKTMDFTCKALDQRGMKITERVEADNEDQAVRRLQSQGCVVLSVAAAGRGGVAAAVPRALKAASRPQMPRLGARRGSSRVKADQVAMLTRELAIMIETGVPVSEALKSLEEHAVNPAISRALAETHAELAQGRTMAQAMAAHP